MSIKLSKFTKSGEISDRLNKSAQKLIPYYKTDFEVNDLEKLAELGTISLSKTYLKDTEAPAILVHSAAQNLLTNNFINYEPETIWLELEKLGLDIPVINRNKIMMINTLLSTDPIIYDVHMFKNMVLCFNNEIPNFDSTEEADPEQIAWAILNLNFLEPKRTYYFDYEPVVYTAAVLHRNGFILAPEILDFAQEDLDTLNVNTELKSDVRNALKGTEVTSDIIKEQLVKLNRIKKYLGIQYNEYTDKLTELLEPETEGLKVAKEIKLSQKLRKRKTTFFADPNKDFPSGTILGDEKSGLPHVYGLDYEPPTFVLTAVGA